MTDKFFFLSKSRYFSLYPSARIFISRKKYIGAMFCHFLLLLGYDRVHHILRPCFLVEVVITGEVAVFTVRAVVDGVVFVGNSGNVGFVEFGASDGEIGKSINGTVRKDGVGNDLFSFNVAFFEVEVGAVVVLTVH